jgi:hypothetical protein
MFLELAESVAGWFECSPYRFDCGLIFAFHVGIELVVGCGGDDWLVRGLTMLVRLLTLRSIGSLSCG